MGYFHLPCRPANVIGEKGIMNTLYHSDNLTILKSLPDASVDLTFTSPPYYNARDYVYYDSYSQYLKALSSVFSEVHKVTKEGRFCVVNTSPVIQARKSRAHSSKRFAIPFDLHHILSKSGWEFIDDIVWVKPEYSSKNRNGGFFQHRTPLGYKPNPISEYLMVYRKQTDKLIDWNMKQYNHDVIQASKVQGDYEKTNVWNIPTSPNKKYTATFPFGLAERIIKYYSFVDDTVLDPFCGSGTTLDASQTLGRRWIGIDQSIEAINVIQARLRDRHGLEYDRDYQRITYKGR